MQSEMISLTTFKKNDVHRISDGTVIGQLCVFCAYKEDFSTNNIWVG